jgi:hypothetical protein
VRPQYTPFYLRFPQERFAVLCLCNVANANPGSRAERVAEVFLGERFTKPPSGDRQESAGSPSAESPKISKDSSWQPSASELAQLAGRYYSPELDAYYTFELTDGVLHFTGLKTMPATKLQPESPSRFRAGQITFQFDPKGLLIDAGRVACYTLRAMFVDLHPATFRLRGDDGYNPRDLCSQAFSDGTELLSGVYRDDGVHPLRDAAARPNRPFAFWLPPNADFTRINNKIFYRLQTG